MRYNLLTETAVSPVSTSQDHVLPYGSNSKSTPAGTPDQGVICPLGLATQARKGASPLVLNPYMC